MRQKVSAFLKKQWLILWIAFTALMLVTLFVSAEYIDQNSMMNRVVVSNSEQYTMFSSNLLRQNGRLYYYPKYVSKLTDEQIQGGVNYDLTLYVWNYDRMNPSRWYPNDIVYDISFKLVEKDGSNLTAEEVGANSIQIVKGDTVITTLGNSNLEYTIKDTLVSNSNTISENRYTIRFPNSWNFESNENICVQVIAEPNNSGNDDLYLDLDELGAIVGLKQLQSMGSSGWEVYINEQRNNSSSEPSDFDAYNLVVAGSGKADITLYIDTTKLSINRYFYKPELSFLNFTEGEVTYTQPDEKGIAKLVIKADSSMNRNTDDDKEVNPEYRNRYDIQLYKKDGDPSSWAFFSLSEGETMPDGVWLTYQITNTAN